MWWNDIKEIKKYMSFISDRLVRIDSKIECVLGEFQELDKFDDYMKNVDKLNEMINEFKGCVSMARGAICENQEKKSPIKRKYVKKKVDQASPTQ